MPTLLNVVCRTTGMGFAAVARVTETRWVACAVQDGIAFDLQPGGELKVDTTLCHTVRNLLAPVVINHVAEDALYRDHRTPALYGFQSYISMPIILADGSFFGTLCAIDPDPHKLDSPETIGMFKLFAELIAFHLDAHAKVASVEAKLLAEHETALLREQFIAVLGHDLRNPLQSLSSGMSRMLRYPAQSTVIIGHMRRSVARMGALIDNVLDFSRGRLGGGLTLTRNANAPLEPTLRQVIAELQSNWEDREILVEIALAGPVNCDHARVAQLLSNLLANALVHGAPEAPIRVSATTQGNMLELSVASGGDPIPPAVLERLFQPFFRGGSSQNGLGLGLFIASEIARAHGGVIEVASDPAETRFTFRMPLDG
ncbi:GAF domain-containing sensor histidine kinase [Humitalea rosea]|nr:GAF domain-containing sensor histidine kinase [Humitalea rosea]